ncbi:unnamed protein product [Jaminaea pallidilutea]
MPSAAAMLRVGRLATNAASPSARFVAAKSLRSAMMQRSFHASPAALELTKFAMPAMSPTMTEGGIAQWKKKEGEAFSAGDVLLEIETDKATMDVEAQDDGVLAKIVVGDGSKNVPVNSIIAITGEEGDDLSGADKLAAEAEKESPSSGKEATPEPPKHEEESSEPKKEPQQEKPSSSSQQQQQQQQQPSSSQPSTSQPKKEGERIAVTPLAKKIALERGIPLGQVKGTGPEGRIVASDVQNFKAEAPAAAPAPSQAKAAPSPSAAPAAAPAPAPAAGASAAYSDVPVSNMRKIIASRLTESKSTVPHYYVSVDVEMDRVLRLRQVFNDASSKRFKDDAAKAKASKLSVGDFITKAVAVALDEVPEVRAAWMGDTIRQYHTSDISIAVSTPTGLITPIVKDVGHRGLTEISSETKELAKLARDGKLKSEQYQGGSFTISNMGMFGPSWFSAIINPPQAAILAIGTTKPVLLPDPESEKGFRTAQVMSATASFDHRVVDGATGARWTDALKRALENPLSFML